MMKGRGPRTDPCGTPDEMFWKGDLRWLTAVQTLRFFRYLWDHESSSADSSSKVERLWMRRAWSTRSNALAMSTKQACTVEPASNKRYHSSTTDGSCHTVDLFGRKPYCSSGIAFAFRQWFCSCSLTSPSKTKLGDTCSGRSTTGR